MNQKTTVTDLKNCLILTVGKRNILFADDDESGSQLSSYLHESRGRRVGKAFAVVFPSSTEEVARVVGACRFHKIPIVPQGGNTGRCFGAQTDDERTVIINLKNMNRIREIDIENMTITVEAGAILQHVQEHAAAYGVFFPLSLGAEASCQIGGNLATNAGGINVLRYGNARELTLGVEAVIANGTVLNSLYGLRKNNTGYDLKNLLIGSEGTLGIITAVTLKLFPSECNNEHGFIAVNTIEDAVSCLRRLQAYFTGKVSTFELMPQAAIALMEKHSGLKCPINNGYAWYVWYKIADSHIDKPLFDDNVAFLNEQMKAGIVVDATVSQNEGMKKYFANIREVIVEAQKYAGTAVKLDIAVPVSSLAQLVERGNAVIETICPEVRPYPFGHVGDGNIHYNLMRPETMSDDEFIRDYKDKLETAVLDIVDGLDGSFSAEHGIGRQKVGLMQTYQDPVALDMMRRIKHAFDPFNLMNPDKVIPALKKTH